MILKELSRLMPAEIDYSMMDGVILLEFIKCVLELYMLFNKPEWPGFYQLFDK